MIVAAKSRVGLICAAVLALGAPAAAVMAPVSAAHAQERREVNVAVGKSEVIELSAPYTEAMVADPEVADILPLSNRSVYVVGKRTGSTVLTIYGPGRRLGAVIDLTVSADMDGLKSRLNAIMPEERGIEVRAANDSLVLSGTVSDAVRLQQAVSLAETYAPGKVVNLLSVQQIQQVMLEVRFSEVTRSAARDIRANLFVNGTEGAAETGDSVSPRVFDGQLNSFLLDPKGNVVQGDLINGALDRFGLISFLSGDVELMLDALEQRGELTTLAEPTLIAMSGDTANFLAGGEFPIPVAQSGGGGGSAGANNTQAITVEFKEFGVGLAFTPTVLQNGVINMIVAPEVSSLDPASSIVINGLRIPGLKTRRARTTVELRDGESFAIAGLIQSDYENTVRQLPLLGDVPILGALFRSPGFRRQETELVIIVTPRLVRPTQARNLVLPTDRYVPPSDFELFLLGARPRRLG